MYLIISKIRTAPYQLCPLENRCVLLLRKHKRNDCTAKVQNKLELEKETRRNLKYFSKKFGAYRNISYISSINEAAKPSGHVKRFLFDYPGKFPARGKTLSTLPKIFWGGSQYYVIFLTQINK